MKENIERYLNDRNNLKCIIAILTALGLLLPWMKLDGAESSLSGAKLIAFTLFGPGQWDLVANSPLSGLLTLTMPAVVVAVTCWTLIQTVRGGSPVGPSVTAIAGLLLLVAFGGGASDSGRIILWGAFIPGIGALLLFLGHTALALANAGVPIPEIKLPRPQPKRENTVEPDRRPPPEQPAGRRTGKSPAPGDPNGYTEEELERGAAINAHFARVRRHNAEDEKRRRGQRHRKTGGPEDSNSQEKPAWTSWKSVTFSGAAQPEQDNAPSQSAGEALSVREAHYDGRFNRRILDGLTQLGIAFNATVEPDGSAHIRFNANNRDHAKIIGKALGVAVNYQETGPRPRSETA